MLKPGYGLDDNGFIVSDVSIDKIDSIYLPCIQESVHSLKKLFPLQLHSVYVYGSIARGDAKPVHSDLDLIALFTKNLSSDEVNQLRTLASELSNKYLSLVRDVGIAIADYDYTMDPSNYYENAFLREISVCVYGEDLGERFGPYKLTSEIPIKFNGDICKSLHRTLNRLETSSDEAFCPYTQGFARKLIRTYYSMVMVRSQIWSTRLHEQSEIFIHYFPHKESIVHTLLNWIDQPPTDRETVQELFKREGNWACVNFIREATTST
ncbi:nucleotidyltransferase domain-containing protein [Oceanobacillus sp. 1P07AA]|uniref:nucleotidyltransferase domain-containing protein n=1 Tax=Oceanobacillus sp. 1P07AA TaxID=3132293 RepID=UPI0039A6B3AB